MSTDRHERAHLVGLIGSGIGGSLSPLLHEHEAAAQGLRYAYRTLDLEELGLQPADAGQLARQAVRLGFTGLNVTHPCKLTVLDGLDELSREAQALGAVNTVVVEGDRLIGHNTDHSGFGAALRAGLPGLAADPARLGTVVLIGAGGAGAAVAHALVAAGAGTLLVADADAARAEALAQSMGRRGGGGTIAAIPVEDVPDRLSEADGIVNATPVGMVGHRGTPFDVGALAPRHWVADVIYRPLETQLVKAARATGCSVLDGGWMASAQAADSFELFTGLAPDRARMREDFLGLAAYHNN
ncbi:shikimate dehydrogenase [Sinomonas terrae]|uniref:Shikimate dehydrogenase (NADP(+)) n=1 Tax=Sinomonas terrae TaxID=2908838 RepID=A0ABS9U0H7_9MICC|nr:shikimate dehydrogenase [Sinomonas terrae]MCH6470100.1 shikimate dehydrogenase [Sinomonas terrae]